MKYPNLVQYIICLHRKEPFQGDRLLGWLLFGVVLTMLPFSGQATNSLEPVTAVKAQMRERYGQLPLSFEVNQGQTDAQVKYLSRGPGYTVFLTSTQVVLSLTKPTSAKASIQSATPKPVEGAVLHMTLEGANSHPQIVGQETLPGKVNYLIGKDPNRWHTSIPTYSKVAYVQVYPGVDLVYYGHQRQLEYDFVVAPGANAESIQLSFEGTKKLSIDRQGNLVLTTPGGEVLLHKPGIYQEINGIRKEIEGGYVLKDAHRVGFQVAAWERTRPLVIDPVLSYSTYLGGNGDEIGQDIAVDPIGNAYVAGTTLSTDFPLAKPLQSANGGQKDVFVTKLNPDGSALVYSSYLGGSGDDEGSGIALDPRGYAYLTGTTASIDFPTTEGAFQRLLKGPSDAFVAKLNPDGSALAYSTYLGGTSDEVDVFGGHSNIAVNPEGNAYVVGTTHSIDFPTTEGAFQRLLKGPSDAFVAKLNPDGSSLVYATYLGGSGYENSLTIAITPSSHAYVAGTMFFSTDFPTTPEAFQKVCGSDAFVTKLEPDGSGLVYSTCLGGSDYDFASSIAVNATGYAYVTGNTVSSDFPTIHALQSIYGGNRDAFVAKLNPDGSALVYSTYLGGSEGDEGNDIVVDGRGYAYITGDTVSPNFPIAHPLQATCGGCWDAFVVKLNPDGSALIFSTFLGGSGVDGGHGIAIDPKGNSYITGDTYDTNDFPTVKPLQAQRGGGRTDAFVAKISTSLPSTKDECMNDGWEALGFENQGQCIQYVNTGK